MPSTGLNSISWKKKYKSLKLKYSGTNLLLVGIGKDEEDDDEILLASFCPAGADVAKDFIKGLLSHKKETP